MFAFIVIEPMSKLSFGFSNIRSLTTQRYISKSKILFPSYNLKDYSILKSSPQASVVKVVVVLIELQTKQVFFPLVHISQFH